jgi:hypothetical protein
VLALLLVLPTVASAATPTADLVLGQADFTSGTANRGGSPTASTLAYPFEALRRGTKLLTVDANNHRVLTWDSLPTTDGAAATLVLGQSAFTTNGSGAAANQFNSPFGADTDGTRLAVADRDNHRVVIWNTFPTTNGQSANLVVGQTGFGTSGSGTSSTGMAGPQAVAIAGGKLFVADSGNSRVLAWSSFPAANGQAADLILGQPDFTSATANNGGTRADSLSSPGGIWSDGTRLFVADTGNNRVLIWSTLPTANRQPADLVLGQADLTTGSPGTSSSTLNVPYGGAIDGTRLLVADQNNHRVLVWDALPTTNGQAADHVLGQPDFTTSAPGTSSSTLNFPTRVGSVSGTAWVADTSNFRIVRFQLPAVAANWVQRSPATHPSNRHYPKLAYDSARGRTVMFGGFDGSSSYLQDTWTWDGTNWTDMNPASNPGGRMEHAVAYDGGRQRVVLFGGRAKVDLGDTWEWSGTNWEQMSPATSPSVRRGATMVYDSARGRVVLWGGFNDTSTHLQDTWEWDGTNWELKAPTSRPSARYEHAMAYDLARQRAVMFGGDQAGNLQDTWEWDGTNWELRKPSSVPSVRSQCGMAYDSVRGRVVLFGGVGGSPYRQDTWEWDGTNWEQMSPSSVPSNRMRHNLAFDSARGRVVMFGGADNSDAALGDTWEYFSISEVPSSPAQLAIRTVSTTLTTVTQGQTGIAVSVSIANTGSTTANVTASALTFSQAGYRVTPGSNATTIAGGTTATFAYTVDISPTATLGETTIDATVSAADSITGASAGDSAADAAASWTVGRSVQLSIPWRQRAVGPAEIMM